MNADTYVIRHFVEIDRGTIAESSDPALIGTERLFATYVDEEGERLCIWDGVSHADALAAAQAWAADFGVPVIDRSKGAL